MIYPSFLKSGDTIGICAPSAGVGDKLDDFEASLSVLKQEGFNIKETASVRNTDQRSADAKTRGQEFNQLLKDPEVKMVLSAAGGDFLNEMIPYADFSMLKKHPKWLMGASDPTGLLYPATTLCDVASFYGMNAGSFDLSREWDYVDNALDVIEGKKSEEYSFPQHMSRPKFMVDTPAYDTETIWQSNFDSFEAEGRCIGGCIDVLKDLIGTPYENTKGFVEKYKEDGQIFYFDNFSMSAENFYRTLKQFSYAGWFEHTKAVLIGRVLFPSSETGMSYAEAAQLALGDIPYVLEADIGHTLPAMVMINGAMLQVRYADGKASLKFEE
ncbi:MAG: S66 peptidase family protein [Lactimicrobium sp.]|jgi:muramoyltetrapeptide carboxypeptidase|uniref:S66 family peptidase n=1 Tax=Lactimicrobium sp. TaxID=2563780 RepID=UPI002F35599D